MLSQIVAKNVAVLCCDMMQHSAVQRSAEQISGAEERSAAPQRSTEVYAVGGAPGSRKDAHLPAASWLSR